MAAKRKDVQVRKLTAEVQRLSGELAILQKCKPMPEACADMLQFMSTEAKNDSLATAQGDDGEENPYTSPAQRQQFNCICLIS